MNPLLTKEDHILKFHLTYVWWKQLVTIDSNTKCDPLRDRNMNIC